MDFTFFNNIDICIPESWNKFLFFAELINLLKRDID